MRVLFATTANDGHFGPLRPLARACLAAGHEVRVAAPASYATALERDGFVHEPFGEPPPELIGPVMASLPTMSFEEADTTVIREVFGRIGAQAGLAAVVATLTRWRPDVVVRESAELASLAAAEKAGVPHVHVCIGMHEIASRFAAAMTGPLAELDALVGLPDGHNASALAAETVFSSVPEVLDGAVGERAPGFVRFIEPLAPAGGTLPEPWGDPALPLVYVTFGSVTGAIPPFRGVFREALDALAGVGARVLLTTGRAVQPADLLPWPPNAHVEQWWPQDAALAHARVMVGHGGFGTTMGALAAGVPQVVTPIFTSDQVANGIHVAAVGAGIAVPIGPGSVTRAAQEVPRVLADPSYAGAARAMADAIAALPRPEEAVRRLELLVG